MKDNIAKGREYQYNKLKDQLNDFIEKLKKLIEIPERFITLEEQLISSELDKIDTQIADLVSQLAVKFFNKLKVAQSHLVYSNEDLVVMKKGLELTKKVLTFSAYLSFETHGKVSLRQLSRVPGQFARCQKAITTNLETGILKEGKDIEVMEAFKLENTVLLGDFERQKKLLKGRSLLKGLFMMLDVNQIFHLILYGVSKKYSLIDISQIPKTLKKEMCGEAEEKLNEMLRENVKDFGFPLYMSAHSINEEVMDKLKGTNTPQLFILTLCRVIIPQDKNAVTEIFYSKLKNSYEIHNANLIFPEYLFLCKLTNTITDNKSQQIQEIEAEESKLITNVKSIYDHFWTNISTKVQKNIHPKVISDRSFFINDLKQQIKEKKKWVESITEASNELELIVN